MSDDTFSSFATIIGAVSSLLAILAVLFYRSHLPQARLIEAEKLHRDIERRVRACSRLPFYETARFKLCVREPLQRLKEELNDHAEVVYCARGLHMQYRLFFNGRSWSIWRTVDRTEEVRARLVRFQQDFRRQNLLICGNISTGAVRVNRQPESPEESASEQDIAANLPACNRFISSPNLGSWPTAKPRGAFTWYHDR